MSYVATIQTVGEINNGCGMRHVHVSRSDKRARGRPVVRADVDDQSWITEGSSWLGQDIRPNREIRMSSLRSRLYALWDVGLLCGWSL